MTFYKFYGWPADGLPEISGVAALARPDLFRSAIESSMVVWLIAP